MRSDSIILLVCATLALIILVKVSATSTVIQKQDINDIRLLRKYREASILQLKKGLEIFFPHNLQGYLAKPGLKDVFSDRANVNGTEICVNRVLARGIGVFDARFAAALIADPEITSAAVSSRSALENGLTGILRGLCSALKLAVGKKSPTTPAEIRAITDQVISAAADWNLQFSNAIGTNRQIEPEIYLMLKEAEDRSAYELVGALNETLFGIQKLASLDLQDGREEISSTMDNFRNRAFTKYVSYVEAKFDASETLLITPPIIGSGLGANSYANRDKTITFQCKMENPTKMAKLQYDKGFSAWINTIQLVIEQISAKNSNGSQSDRSGTTTAKKETTALFNSAIDTAMNALFRIHPECLSIVGAKRDAAIVKMKKIFDNIYNSIDSMRRIDPKGVVGQIEASEVETDREAPGIVVDLFDGILYCFQHAHSSASAISSSTERSHSSRNGGLLGLLPGIRTTSPSSSVEQSTVLQVDAELRRSVQDELEKSITSMKKFFQTIFIAMKVRSVEIASGIQAKIKVKDLPTKQTQSEAFISGKTAMEIIVDVIVTLSEVYANQQFDKAASLLANQVYREKISFKIQRGVDLIFSSIVNSEDEVEENTSKIIKAGHAVTSATYTIALQSLFCSFQNTTSKTIGSDGRASFASQQRGVDDAFMAIEKAAGNNSCEFLSDLETVENIVTDHFANMTIMLYNEIRKRSSYDAQMESILARTQNTSISSAHLAASVGFKAIRTLATINCPSSKTHSLNTLSAFIGNYKTAFTKLDGFTMGLSEGVESVPATKVDKVLHRVSSIVSNIRSRINSLPLIPIRLFGAH